MSDLVDRLEVSQRTIGTDALEGDGTLTWSSTTIVAVHVWASGCVGLGYTYGPGACADVVRDQLTDVVVGIDPMNVPRANRAMQRAVRNAGRPGVAGCAISAVDIALWDLKARLLGLPLHRLLGAVENDVPVYGSGGFTTYDEQRLRRQLGGWVHDQQVPRVKIKIGESFGSDMARDLDRMTTARDTIGAGTELYVDANGGYTAKQAIRLMQRASELDVRWLEEPVSSDDLAGLRQVRQAVSADVTAGEYGYHLPYFQHMLAAEAVDCLQVDVTRCGGITEWLRVAALAAANGLDVSAHCAPHLHAHVAASVPNVRHIEWFHTHIRIENLLFDGTLDPSGGFVTPSHAAGHGLSWRADP